MHVSNSLKHPTAALRLPYGLRGHSLPTSAPLTIKITIVLCSTAVRYSNRGSTVTARRGTDLSKEGGKIGELFSTICLLARGVQLHGSAEVIGSERVGRAVQRGGVCVCVWGGGQQAC